jgi:integrase/recombinase XerD
MPIETKAVPRVEVVSRHRADCPRKDKGVKYVRCDCPKALYWYANGRPNWETAGTTDYQMAERRAFQKQADFETEVNGAPEHNYTTITEAINLYLQSKTASGYTQKSIDRLTLIFRERMETFFTQRGLVHLKDIKRAELEQWRATWTGSASTKGKYQGRVKGFFDWAVKADMIDKNPALGLERIKGARDVAPTLALNDEQFSAVLSAIDRLTHRDAEEIHRFRALVLLQRWSGLAIKDAITAERTRFKKTPSGWYRLFLRRAKTGVDVYASIAPAVAEQILSAPCLSERYIFWDGKKDLQQTINLYGAAYRRVSELAALKDEHGQPLQIHSHMMRDTFAVWCFTQGMATEDVAALLGHRNITVTQQHYSPWIMIRQERLGSIVETAYTNWTTRPENAGISA